MTIRDSCTECDASLTESDLRESPNFPEVGYVFYKCPDCGHRMPGPPDASPGEESSSYLPSDPDWRENPRDYHDQMDLKEAVFNVIREEDGGDGATREEVFSEANERFALRDEETGDIIEQLLMSGRCFEPADDRLKAL